MKSRHNSPPGASSSLGASLSGVDTNESVHLYRKWLTASCIDNLPGQTAGIPVNSGKIDMPDTLDLGESYFKDHVPGHSTASTGNKPDCC